MKNMIPRMLPVAVCLIALNVFAIAQKPTPSPTLARERPHEIVALLNDARLAAPELAVDTFLKVVESKRVVDPVWRKEIIEEALRMIDDVQYPMAMGLAFGRGNELNDAVVAFTAGAFRANLDRLSFKGRVITLFLETDPARAKQMIFQMGGDLGLKPRSCEDVMSYSPDSIYPVVAKVAAASFTDKQVAEGQRALFVAPWIENIDSPTQIYAALDLVQKMQGSQAERQILFSAISRAIDRDFKDDRSFTHEWDGITGRIGKLAGGETDPLKNDLKDAFRGMLLKNLRGTRCTDNEIKKDQPLPEYIEAANKLFTEKPLTYEDIAASELKGTVKVSHILTKSATAKRLRDEAIAVQGVSIVDLLDGEKQSIEYFADSEAPLSVAIIVDMSGSTIPVIKEIREAAKAFVEQLNPADQAVVLTFDQSTTIDVVCKLTSDKKRLSGKIGSLYHHFSGLRNGRDPAITPDMYDTIYRAITKEFVGVKGRKAMIVLTDGFIHGQTVTPRVFDDMIVEGDTVIYPMMFLTSEHMGRRTDGITYEELYKLPVTIALNSIAIKTGGRLLISAKGTDFKTAFASVADELRKQYVVGFYPSNTDKRGSGHIAISINRPEAKFRTKATIRVKPLAEPK